LRDFPKPGAISIHFKSVENPKCPPKPKYVRAETVITGYIMEEEVINGQVCTNFTLISENDLKGNLPKKLVNMAAAKETLVWINNLIKGS
jgi:hypothetical protein